jgi:hypothetical protein
MEWQFIVALILGVPIILFPVAFAWFLNIGSIYVALRKARAKRGFNQTKARETAS